MTREEKAIIYFKDLRKRFCEDFLLGIPKNTAAYKATLAEKDFYDTAIEALQKEPCGDCINRQAVLEQINCWIGSGEYKYTNATYYLTKRMQDLSPVIPQHKMGRWIPIEYDGYADGFPVWDKWECSECGYEHNGDKDSLTAFCPDCGVKMEVEE